MAEVIFSYGGNNITIKCNLDDKMKDIIHIFLTKISKKGDKTILYFIYQGTNINQELTFNEQANELDKNTKKNEYFSKRGEYNKKK